MKEDLGKLNYLKIKMLIEKEVEIQKKMAEFFRSLEMELKELQKRQKAAGWTQRKAIYEHVNADYTLQQKVLTSKENYEQVTFSFSLLKDIIELLNSDRNIFGLYDHLGMKRTLEQQLKFAEERNEFLIALEILNHQKTLCKFLDN